MLGNELGFNGAAVTRSGCREHHGPSQGGSPPGTLCPPCPGAPGAAVEGPSGRGHQSAAGTEGTVLPVAPRRHEEPRAQAPPSPGGAKQGIAPCWSPHGRLGWAQAKHRAWALDLNGPGCKCSRLSGVWRGQDGHAWGSRWHLAGWGDEPRCSSLGREMQAGTWVSLPRALRPSLSLAAAAGQGQQTDHRPAAAGTSPGPHLLLPRLVREGLPRPAQSKPPGQVLPRGPVPQPVPQQGGLEAREEVLAEQQPGLLS